MTERFTITILPDNIQLMGNEGDNLYTLLLVEGVIPPNEPGNDRFRLEKGTVSPAEHPENEEAAFPPAKLAEGWILAAEHLISGDAVLNRNPEEEAPPAPPVQETPEGYGLVYDLGSGTITVGLTEIRSLRIPLFTAGRNSQLSLIPDPIALWKWARRTEGGVEKLREHLFYDINRLAEKTLHRAGIPPQKVKAVCCTGNGKMMDLLTPGGMGSQGRAGQYSPAELGILPQLKDRTLYILPGASKALGADIVSSSLAADLQHKIDQPGVTLLIHLGMEGYVVAAGRGRLLAAKVDSMPFEGNGIRWGMPSLTGAITRVEIDEDVRLRTVKNARPRGINGAGLLSAVLALAENGLLDQEGHMLQPEGIPERVASHLESGIGGREFILSFPDQTLDHPISICQEDVLQVQMAKGAIRAACKAILHAMEAWDSDVEMVLLSESYRAHLDPITLMKLDMLPAIAPEQIKAIGNSAWQGACICLAEPGNLREAEDIAGRMERLDTTADRIYAEEFIKGMSFGPVEK